MLFRRQRHFRCLGAQPHRGIVEHRATSGRSGIVAGQRVDADAAFERRARPDAFRHQHARLQTRRTTRACSTTSPRALPSRTLSPSAMPSARRIIADASAPSAVLRAAANVGVSVKLVLRKLRAGAVTSGTADPASLHRSLGHVIGQSRHARLVRPERAPSRARNETACPAAGTREEMRILERRRGVDPALVAAPSPHPASPDARSVASMISIAVISKPAMLRAQPRRQALQHLVVRPAFARRLDQLRRRSGCGCVRRPDTDRRAP